MSFKNNHFIIDIFEHIQKLRKLNNEPPCTHHQPLSVFWYLALPISYSGFFFPLEYFEVKSRHPVISLTKNFRNQAASWSRVPGEYLLHVLGTKT